MIVREQSFSPCTELSCNVQVGENMCQPAKVAIVVRQEAFIHLEYLWESGEQGQEIFNKGEVY